MIAVVVLGTLFTLFATTVLLYVSIATMVGPWIGPTIVLLSDGILRLFCRNHERVPVSLIQAMSAGAGLVATGVGFAFPMLYFLDQPTFEALLANPWQFAGLLSATTLCAGLLGLWAASWMGPTIFARTDCSFPVAQVTFQALDAQEQPKQMRFLGFGSMVSIIISILKDGIGKLPALLPATLAVVPEAVMKTLNSLWGAPFAFSLALPVWPSMWAIGFIIGTSSVVPLAVGIAMQWCIRGSVARFPELLGTSFEACSVPFCSGLLMAEFLLGSILSYKFLKTMQTNTIRISQGIIQFLKTLSTSTLEHKINMSVHAKRLLFLAPLVLTPTICFFWYFNLPLHAQVLLFALIGWATYVMVLLGCQIGLIQFGRFSTLVVVPLMLLFGLNGMQATLVCVFFNICAAVAADALFDEQIAKLANVSLQKTRAAQLLGLLVCAASIGWITWLLCTHLHLGSSAFFAQRGKAKALLLQSLGFDWRLLIVGFLFGWAFKKTRISSTMVFSGVVMPTSISMGLIAGGLLSYLGKKKTELITLCAGIFATEAIWILVRALLIPLFWH